MSNSLLPTTQAQVSGHRFLRRRVEHGLVLGDVRMIHDPLRSRSRAMLFGIVATVLVGLGAGLLAWLNPNADPGDSVVLRADNGTLYVRVDDRVHPVANLASARIIAGNPEDPASIGEEHLAGLTRGAPIGIPGAPGLIADPEDLSARPWAACWDGQADTVTVLAGAPTRAFGAEQAMLAAAPDGGEWVLTSDGRISLPPEPEREGRVLRRALGITPETPRAQPPPEVLSALTEVPAWQAPADLPEILRTGAGDWLLRGGALTAVTPTQADILADLGAPERDMERTKIADYPDSDLGTPHLPAQEPEWLDPEVAALCANGQGGAGTAPQGLQPVELSGTGVADFFAGLAHGAAAVDTGHGFHVVSATGVRHSVPNTETLSALGTADPQPARWEIIRLLPEGEELGREQALRATY